uniref:TSA: Wollemia nobilis Ref_Wollemi_Transcript_11271_1776 transcribed RNA sequence n=1 Tax=Wollemia nobilis TaxID=56998 RepID=A0A0C9RM83_9CONI
MVKEEEEDWHNEWADDHKDFLRGVRGWRMSVPKVCDVCQVSDSVMFCRAHSAHLCMVCDVKIHGGSNNTNRRSSSSPSSSLCHERVWLCEVCEQAPASVTCKADAAALCVSCDSDIHSANPLARKHERIPVTPFYESPNMGNNNNSNKFNSINLECNDVLNEDHDEGEDRRLKRDDDDEECNGLLSHRSEHGNHEAEMCCAEEAAVAAASWLIPEAGKNNLRIINGVAEGGGGEDKTVKDKLKFKAYLQSIDFLEDVDDPYVGFEYLASNGGNTAVNANGTDALAPTHLGATDSMVPVHTPEVIEHSSTKVSDESGSLDADLSKNNYGYRSASLNNSVSSCIDVGIVPESSMNEIYNKGARGSFEIPPRVVHNPGTQFEAMGREARVLRYREKRKNRKFEKTIRYASRKAYAETRPRIKGRFAKRTDVEEVEGEVEHMYSSSSSVLSDQGYGVVPSF